MSYENISAELSEEEFNQMVQKLKEIEATLSFAVNLTADDIRSLYLLGDKSLAFVEASFRYATERQNLFPSYLRFDEFRRDFNLYNQLKQILEYLKPLTEKVTDTLKAVGSEVFAASRGFYKTVQEASAAGVAGCDAIAEDLGKRFDYLRRSEKPKEQGTEAEESAES
jgi:hypothetical protein